MILRVSRYIQIDADWILWKRGNKMSNVVTMPVNSSINEENEIQLESGYEENAVPHTKLVELTQFSLFKSYCVHYTLFDGHFLSVYSKTVFSKPKNYWLNLAYLEPTPRRVLKIDRPALYATGILSLAAVVVSLINGFSDEPWTLLPTSVAMICSALIAFLVLIYRSRDRVVFYSRYGRVNWLEFLIKKPNQRAYKEFIEKIGGASHAVSSRQSSRHELRLGAELREHRRLRDEGVLPSKVYEDVKGRLLGQHTSLNEVFKEDNNPKDKTEINSSNLTYVVKALFARLVNNKTTMRENNKKPALPANQ